MLRSIFPRARHLKSWWRRFRRARPPAKVVIGAAVVLILLLTVNWLFFPVSGTLYKTPSETWAEYSPVFSRYATIVMTPGLLAAIAQVEGSGNPVARTYWRWAWTSQPFEMYRPASSAVGMYQITDGTFAESRRYCIHDHAVARVCSRP